jgi:hypothetical protein
MAMAFAGRPAVRCRPVSHPDPRALGCRPARRRHAVDTPGPVAPTRSRTYGCHPGRDRAGRTRFSLWREQQTAATDSMTGAGDSRSEPTGAR